MTDRNPDADRDPTPDDLGPQGNSPDPRAEDESVRYIFDDGPPATVPAITQNLLRSCARIDLTGAGEWTRTMFDAVVRRLHLEHAEFVMVSVGGLKPLWDDLAYRYTPTLADEFARHVRQSVGVSVAADVAGRDLPAIVRAVATAREDFARRGKSRRR